MHIRPVVPDDIDAMIDLFRASVRTVGLRDYTAEQVMAWAPDQIDQEGWRARYRQCQGWVAEIDGRLAGFSDLEADGHLNMMYVSPDHQGAGVASALLAQVEAAAREAGISRLFTEASKIARPFFERRGFRVIAPQEVPIRGQVLVNFRMDKTLG